MLAACEHGAPRGPRAPHKPVPVSALGSTDTQPLSTSCLHTHVPAKGVAGAGDTKLNLVSPGW